MKYLVRDEATGEVHEFEVKQDNYGVSVTHDATGHSVILEIFNGRLRGLVFRNETDEAVVNHILEENTSNGSD